LFCLIALFYALLIALEITTAISTSQSSDPVGIITSINGVNRDLSKLHFQLSLTAEPIVGMVSALLFFAHGLLLSCQIRTIQFANSVAAPMLFRVNFFTGKRDLQTGIAQMRCIWVSSCTTAECDLLTILRLSDFCATVVIFFDAFFLLFLRLDRLQQHPARYGSSSFGFG
jgi:hypothetical protein